MKNKSIWNEMKPYLIISFGMLVYAFAATGFLVPQDRKSTRLNSSH